ncbi:hypothetical protein [Microbispora hainanensis]|uniref:Uncharacterized protein n=1 Tax=Microbispora hainanensis TaxID=568844 RepID=A0A544Y9A9_9ACTN|nr:hypothetical protein [Microbispora hainanensis]TQS13320.1 hypothetical protein FLX08_35195 [Microbispora hainanensis]
MNGYVLPCLPAEHGSVLTTALNLRAWCGECGVTYPGKFVIEPGTPPPFEWAREPKNTLCSCEPRWPRLMVMFRGRWYLGHPGSHGRLVVDGASDGAFCRNCGAGFLGEMVIDLDDTSHLEKPGET